MPEEKKASMPEEKKVSRRNYLKYAGAGIVVVAVAGAGAYYAMSPTAAPPSTTEMTTAPPPTTQTTSAPAPTTAVGPWSLAEAAKPYKGQKLTVLTYSGQYYREWSLDTAAKYFTPLGIDIVCEEYSPDTAIEKMTADFMGKVGAYDVIGIYAGPCLYPEEIGAAVPISSFFNDPKLFDPNWNPDDFEPNFQKYLGYWDSANKTNFGGTWSGLAYAFDGQIFFYRTDLFDKYSKQFESEYGRPLKPALTWDDTIQMGEFFTKKVPGYYGFVVHGASAVDTFSEWLAILYSCDGRQVEGSIAEKNLKPAFNNDAGLKSLQIYKQMADLSPPGSNTFSGTDVIDTYLKGKVAMSQEWSFLGAISEIPDRAAQEVLGNVRASLIPGLKEEWAGRSTAGGNAWTISQYSKNPGLAWLFIQQMNSRETEKYAATTWAIHPGRVSNRNDPEVVNKLGWYFPVLVESYNRTMAIQGGYLVTLPENTEVQQIAWTNISSVLVGQKQPQDALNAMEKGWLDVFRSAGYTT